jgi:hypothetical protein
MNWSVTYEYEDSAWRQAVRFERTKDPSPKPGTGHHENMLGERLRHPPE